TVTFSMVPPSARTAMGLSGPALAPLSGDTVIRTASFPSLSPPPEQAAAAPATMPAPTSTAAARRPRSPGPEPPTRMWFPPVVPLGDRSACPARSLERRPVLKGPVPAKCGYRPFLGFFYRLVGEMAPVVLENQTHRRQERGGETEHEQPPAENDAERDDRGRQPAVQRPPAVRAEEAHLARGVGDLTLGVVLVQRPVVGPLEPPDREVGVEPDEPGEADGQSQRRGAGPVLGPEPVHDVGDEEEERRAVEHERLDAHRLVPLRPGQFALRAHVRVVQVERRPLGTDLRDRVE